MGDIRHLVAELRAPEVQRLMRAHRVERGVARAVVELVAAGLAEDVAVNEMLDCVAQARRAGSSPRHLCRQRARELLEEKAATT